MYELPARNAGGFAKIRPIASSELVLTDFASWRGLLALTGLRGDALDHPRVISDPKSEAAVWLGSIDELWQLGKPTGRGFLTTQTPLDRNQPTDPFLMTGSDVKRVTRSHDLDQSVTFTLQLDVTGN